MIVRGRRDGNQPQVALARFLDYGHVPMAKGLVERLHVRAALTRKNSLPAPTRIAYTILGSYRLLPQVPWLDLPDLLPHHWKQRRDAAAALCAAVYAGCGCGGRPWCDPRSEAQ